MYDDGQMLKAFCDGNFDDIDNLVRQHEDKLYSLCYRLTRRGADADDLYQQTWLLAVRKAHTFNGKSLKAWLYTICVNAYRDNWRKQKRRADINGANVSGDEKDYMMSIATEGLSAESQALRRIEDRHLARLVEALPDKHRLPVILHYFEGLGYQECADTLHIPIGTVKSRLSYAKQKLRKELEKTND